MSTHSLGGNGRRGIDRGDVPVILALVAAIVATVVAFDRIDRRAAALMLPSLAWVAFATYLDAGFWYLN